VTATETSADAAPDPFAAARPYYQGEIAAGVERFFEPRRESCPWCGSGTLSVRLRTGDMLQRKPGVFTLERCDACRHIFQNPRLTPEGLDFYYRDFYDGLGQETWERTFSSMGDAYRARAEMVRRQVTPKAWLDVGCGYGHFAKDARPVLPETRFDGLDFGASVDEGRRRGWLDTAYNGSFADLADELTGRYDVVSMHHYLEHTRDQKAELDTAARVLGPGGHLLIEVPDPECVMGRLLGHWWVAWFQPQHQHFVPLPNLVQALADRGFTTVAIDRGAAQIPGDLTYALVLAILALAPDPKQPWLPGEPTAAAARRNTKAWKVGAKVLKASWQVDRLVDALARRADRGNAYRILARKAD
jgi:ubiquinone/menaquinone biosynthesis C-methylase UbiE